ASGARLRAWSQRAHRLPYEPAAHHWRLRKLPVLIAGAAQESMRALRRNGGAPLRHDTQLVQRAEQLGGVPVDAISSGAAQLIVAVPAAQEAHAQHARPARRQ